MRAIYICERIARRERMMAAGRGENRICEDRKDVKKKTMEKENQENGYLEIKL